MSLRSIWGCCFAENSREMHQFPLILVIDCTVFVPPICHFRRFILNFILRTEITSYVEFLVQALAVPVLVPLPTGVKEKRRQ